MKEYEMNPGWVQLANCVMIFVLAALLSVLLFPLRVHWGIPALDAIHLSVWGYAVGFGYFSYLVLSWKGGVVRKGYLVTAILLGALVVDLPVHLVSWYATLGSSPDLLSRVIGIFFGLGFFLSQGKRAKWMLTIGFLLLMLVMTAASQALSSMIY